MAVEKEKQSERKHRIAVVSNAWSSEFLSAALEGVREEAERDASDLFIFVTYNLVGASPGQNNSPLQLFDLIDPQKYDGFILFSNTFNIPEEHESVQRLMKRAHIPFVSTEVREPGASLVGTSNYKGIYDLSCHLIDISGQTGEIRLIVVP